MDITDKTVLITGANRSIGKGLIEEALQRGAKRICAAMRSPVQHSDERVTPLTLDVTNASQIERAVEQVDLLDLLINNAGIAIYDDLSNPRALAETLAVNSSPHCCHDLCRNVFVGSNAADVLNIYGKISVRLLSRERAE